MKMNRQLLLIILVLIRNSVFAQSDSTIKQIHLAEFDKKRISGIALGAGPSHFQVSNSEWKQGTINYHDSLESIETKSIFRFDLSILYRFNFSKYVAFRPGFALSFEGGSIQYNNPQTVETLETTTSTVVMSFPFLFKYRCKSFQPYIIAGPDLLFMLDQDDKAKNLLPLKTFDILCDAGIGVDLILLKSKVIISPEIKYSMGFLNQKGTANNMYANTIAQLKRQAVVFTLNLCSGIKHQPK